MQTRGKTYNQGRCLYTIFKKWHQINSFVNCSQDPRPSQSEHLAKLGFQVSPAKPGSLALDPVSLAPTPFSCPSLAPGTGILQDWDQDSKRPQFLGWVSDPDCRVRRRGVPSLPQRLHPQAHRSEAWSCRAPKAADRVFGAGPENPAPRGGAGKAGPSFAPRRTGAQTPCCFRPPLRPANPGPLFCLLARIVGGRRGTLGL